MRSTRSRKSIPSAPTPPLATATQSDSDTSPATPLFDTNSRRGGRKSTSKGSETGASTPSTDATSIASTASAAKPIAARRQSGRGRPKLTAIESVGALENAGEEEEAGKEEETEDEVMQDVVKSARSRRSAAASSPTQHLSSSSSKTTRRASRAIPARRGRTSAAQKETSDDDGGDSDDSAFEPELDVKPTKRAKLSARPSFELESVELPSRSPATDNESKGKPLGAQIKKEDDMEVADAVDQSSDEETLVSKVGVRGKGKGKGRASAASTKSVKGKGKAKAVDPDSDSDEDQVARPIRNRFAKGVIKARARRASSQSHLSEDEAEDMAAAIKASLADSKGVRSAAVGASGAGSSRRKLASRSESVENSPPVESSDEDDVSEFELPSEDDSLVQSVKGKGSKAATDDDDDDVLSDLVASASSDEEPMAIKKGKRKSPVKPAGTGKFKARAKKGKGKKKAASEDDDDEKETEDEEEVGGTSAGDASGAEEDAADPPLIGMKRKKLSTAERKKLNDEDNRYRRLMRGKNWYEKNQIQLERHHTELQGVWETLEATVPVYKPVQVDQPEGLTCKLLPFQKEGLDWMLNQEKSQWHGGMLADEMGMGKTIQTIALILSDRNTPGKKLTLVLAPTVAIMQWRNEISKYTQGFKVNVWHGGNRSSDLKELKKFDIILTSYAVLESSFRRQNSGFKKKGELLKEASVLHEIEWHRIILDEAHNIKDRACNTAKGAFALKGTYRWCLSGTPLQNRVGELYSLVRFMGADPFCYYYCKRCPCKTLYWMFSDKRHCDNCGCTPMHHTNFWNNEVLKPIQNYGQTGYGKVAFDKLRILLERLMLRRTKVERADDLGLPPRTVIVRRDYFTEEEEEMYASLYTDVKRKFSTFIDAGTVLNNYSNIFTLITRMRQMALHPDLVLKSRTAKNLLEGANGEELDLPICQLCLDEAEDGIHSKCRHLFCRLCISEYIETAIVQHPECPVCHLQLSIDLSQEAEQPKEGITPLQRRGILNRIDPTAWRTSTKIEALVEELSKLKSQDHSLKAICFSQYTSFLDLVARRLQLAGFRVARLQGSMTPQARDNTIKYFMDTPDCTVFLLSLKAGGVALNLVEASRCFILDPWWNPSVELQAMDRIHRLGQKRPVVITRLIIENSIESRIVELQKKKESMAATALGDDAEALGRLTPEDLRFLFVM